MAHRNNSRRLFCGTSLHILEAFQHALKRKHLETNGNELQASVDQTTEIAVTMRKNIETDEMQGCKEQR